MGEKRILVPQRRRSLDHRERREREREDERKRKREKPAHRGCIRKRVPQNH